MHGSHEQYSVAVGHQGANKVVADEWNTMRHAGNDEPVLRQSPTPRGQLECKARVANEATLDTLLLVAADGVETETGEEERIVAGDETATLRFSQWAGPCFVSMGAGSGGKAANQTSHVALSPCSTGKEAATRYRVWGTPRKKRACDRATHGSVNRVRFQ